MNANSLTHSHRVKALLDQVDADRRAMLKLGMRVFGTDGAPIFPLDLMASGAVKRNISTARAFRLLVETWNMVCARALGND